VGTCPIRPKGTPRHQPERKEAKGADKRLKPGLQGHGSTDPLSPLVSKTAIGFPEPAAGRRCVGSALPLIVPSPGEPGEGTKERRSIATLACDPL